jgi:hypothetical protein
MTEPRERGTGPATVASVGLVLWSKEERRDSWLGLLSLQWRTRRRVARTLWQCRRCAGVFVSSARRSLLFDLRQVFSRGGRR